MFIASEYRSTPRVNMRALLLLSVSLSVGAAGAGAGDSIQVVTSSGQVQGHQVVTTDPRTGATTSYSSFTNIPFAKPPVGDLRSGSTWYRCL